MASTRTAFFAQCDGRQVNKVWVIGPCVVEIVTHSDGVDRPWFAGLVDGVSCFGGYTDELINGRPAIEFLRIMSAVPAPPSAHHAGSPRPQAAAIGRGSRLAKGCPECGGTSFKARRSDKARRTIGVTGVLGLVSGGVVPVVGLMAAAATKQRTVECVLCGAKFLRGE